VKQPPAKPTVSPREKLEARLRWVMSTEQGRAAMWWLLDEVGGLFSPAFAGEQTHVTAYEQGKRAVAIELMQQLKRSAPADYRAMLRERLEIEDRDLATSVSD
jgi:hypothetical protein